MDEYSVFHLDSPEVLRRLHDSKTDECAKKAWMLAYLGEADARRLYAPKGHPSMLQYCVSEMNLSGDSAFKRIRVARLAREFSEILPRIADGRLNLSAVVLLSTHLTRENCEELLAAASNRTRNEIQLMLARRFPQPDVPARIQALPSPALVGALPAPGPGAVQLAPGRVATLIPVDLRLGETIELAPGRVADSSPSNPNVPHPRITPLAPERFALQVTISQELYDKLQYAKGLLGHAVPKGDLEQILDRALDTLIAKHERRRFAASERTRPRRSAGNQRYVPAEIRRAVWKRDHGRCTFVGENGHRCTSNMRLEFDHITPVARGGRTSVEQLRLRCRAHNQYEAEQAFGAEFMRARRERSS